PTQLGELLDREPRARLDDVASSGEDPSGLVELPGDPVVPDPPESNLGFERDRRVSHENDLTVGRQHIARPLGEPTLEPDVDCTSEVPGGEVGGLPGVEQHRTRSLSRKHVVDVEQGRWVIIEEGAELAVAMRV